MPLSDKAIEDFRRVYRSAYGEDISRDEANVMGLEILRLIRLLLQRRPTRGPESGGSLTDQTGPLS